MRREGTKRREGARRRSEALTGLTHVRHTATVSEKVVRDGSRKKRGTKGWYTVLKKGGKRVR